jgi:hypothetical protein
MNRYQVDSSLAAKSHLELENECNRFNVAIRIGDLVAYREVLRDDCPVQVFATRSPAQVLSGHSAVVWLTGKSGCVLISHCRKATRADVEAHERAMQEAAERASKDAAEAAHIRATPYYVRPAAFKQLREGNAALCRLAGTLDPDQIRLYEQGFVDALVKSVRELMRLATRNDVPEAEQIAIAERAQDLLDRFENDEPVPF